MNLNFSSKLQFCIVLDICKTCLQLTSVLCKCFTQLRINQQAGVYLLGKNNCEVTKAENFITHKKI